MPKQDRKKKTRRGKRSQDWEALPPLNPNAAGIDVGNAEHYVAVPAGRDAEPVQKFGSFTADLHRMAGWLKACGIQTVVMQATGVYWMALYQILEEHSLQVNVVNAHHTKTLPGRKTDVLECQWLQKLHTFGLLNNSFQPVEEIRVLRTYMRQREKLVAGASTCIQHIQKALTEMNIQLANVISDISGLTGMTILRAILNGERNPQALARLKGERIQATREEIAQSLEGTWRPELLFTLEQSLALYDTYQQKIVECNLRIEAHLQSMESKTTESKTTVEQPAPKGGRNQGGHRKQTSWSDLRSQLFRIAGVDLTQIDGIQVQTAQTLISEVGVDMSRWKTEKQFASWLGLCPDNRISGGKVLKRGTRHVVNRAATALRLAAWSLFRSRSALGRQLQETAAKTGSTQSGHCHGSQTRQASLPHAEIWPGICG